MGINESKKAEEMRIESRGWTINWRVVMGTGVYGPGMDKGKMEGVEFLEEVLRRAVLNQNLVMPSGRDFFRLLCIDDWVEGVMGAMFLRETERGCFELGGEETAAEEIATVLIDEAKMTRVKVMLEERRITEIDEEKIKETWGKLRWRPEIGFRKGIKETLQYFFGKIEEERRGVKKEEKEERVEMREERGYEVVVEGKEEKEEKKEEKIAEEAPEVSVFEIKKIGEVEKEIVEVRDEISEIKTETKEIEQRTEPEKKKRFAPNWSVIGLGWVILLLIGVAYLPMRWVWLGVSGIKGVAEAKEMIEEKSNSERFLSA